jgi:hypothetical protein
MLPSPAADRSRSESRPSTVSYQLAKPGGDLVLRARVNYLTNATPKTGATSGVAPPNQDFETLQPLHGRSGGGSWTSCPLLLLSE